MSSDAGLTRHVSDTSAALPNDRHPAAVYLARLAPGSRRAMRQALDNLARMATENADAETLAWHHLRYQHTQALRTRLTERYDAASTVNRHLSALRGVLREAWRLGLMSAEDRERACDLASVRSSRVPAGRALETGELRCLFDTCDPRTPMGARDAALLALLYGAGLRRSEVVGLDLGSFDPESGALRVRGKGGQGAHCLRYKRGIGSPARMVERAGRSGWPLALPGSPRGARGES